MNSKELRELDEWLKRLWPNVAADDWPDYWSPTRDPRNAMDVLEKCAEKAVDQITITGAPGRDWTVGLANCDFGRESSLTSAETLPLAICLFCKKLYGPTNS